MKNNSGSIPKESPLRRIYNEITLDRINDCINAFRDLEGPAPQNEIKKDGKLGLALSGGGFRASIFHIGVLAALAEAHKLKDVEVLSCVPGGSIIGTYYYLKLKELYERKQDLAITQGYFIELVADIEKKFLKGVQENLRLKLLTDP